MLTTNGPEPVKKDEILVYRMKFVRPGKHTCDLYPYDATYVASRQIVCGRVLHDALPGEEVHVVDATLPT